MLKKMASKSILLLGILLVVTTKVFSYNENHKIVVNYENSSIPYVAARLVISPVSPVVAVPTPSPAKAPTQTSLSPRAPPPTPLVKSWKDCIPLCFRRCKLHLRKILCMTTCMTCCDRCKCVPPGIYGNREKCGKCYLYMSTHHNKYKCP